MARTEGTALIDFLTSWRSLKSDDQKDIELIARKMGSAKLTVRRHLRVPSGRTKTDAAAGLLATAAASEEAKTAKDLVALGQRWAELDDLEADDVAALIFNYGDWKDHVDTRSIESAIGLLKGRGSKALGPTVAKGAAELRRTLEAGLKVATKRQDSLDEALGKKAKGKAKGALKSKFVRARGRR